MNISINDRLDATIQDEKEKKFRDNLFAEIDKDISDDEDRKYICSLYLRLMTQQVSQFSGNDKDKSDFFKELSGNELFSKSLLRILKILCQMNKAYSKDKNNQWRFNWFVDKLSQKTNKAFVNLLREFEPVKQTLYTVTDENNEQTQYCTIELESMITVHTDPSEIIMNSSANTCATGNMFKNSISRIKSVVSNSSEFGIEGKQIDENEFVKSIGEPKNDIKVAKKILQDKDNKLSTGIDHTKLSISPSDITSVINSFQTWSEFWNTCNKQFGLNVFNMCIRGKGSDDTSGIDKKESNNVLCRLNRDLDGADKLVIRKYKGIANFLFDQVSESKDNDLEPYDYRNSVLNDNGKQITERVLGLLLPSDYKICYQDGKMLVTQPEETETEYRKIANKINGVVKSTDEYTEKEIKYKKLAKEYRNDGNAEKSKEMYEKAKECSNLANAPAEELESAFGNWLSEFCPKDCTGLPNSESEFRKKLNIDTDSYRNLRECFKKTFRLSTDISKNMFDDMLAIILYRYTEQIHAVPGGNPTLEQRSHVLQCIRRNFVSNAYSVIEAHAVKYFKHMDEFQQKALPSEIYNLPGNFFKYNENDPDIMYSPLNYIQVLIQTTAVLMQIDSADKETRKIFNRNANKLVWMVESKTNKDKKYYQNLQTKINEYVSTHPDIKRQEVLVGLLCKGIKNFTKTKCRAICNMAHQITEFDLDNPMRVHVTQLNFVRAKKDKNGELIGCKLDANGILSVEVNLTAQLKDFSTVDELVNCETKAEIKAKLDNFNWDNLRGVVDTEQFLKRLDMKAVLPDYMDFSELSPFLWSEHEYVRYIFSKSYSMKCVKRCAKFWVFTVYSNGFIHAFRWGFLRALIERIIAFFPCVFFLMLALIFYPFSRYNTNRIYRFIEQTVRTKLGDKINNINPDNDHDESKNQKLKQNDLGEQESDDFLGDLDFDLFNIKTDSVVQPVVPLVEPIKLKEPIKPIKPVESTMVQPQQDGIYLTSTQENIK